MGRAGLLGYLGTGGLRLERIESDIRYIQSELPADGRYGMNLLGDLSQPELEQRTVDTFFRYGVRFVEASAYMQITPGLVRYLATGLSRIPAGRIEIPHHVLARFHGPKSLPRSCSRRRNQSFANWCKRVISMRRKPNSVVPFQSPVKSVSKPIPAATPTAE